MPRALPALLLCAGAGAAPVPLLIDTDMAFDVDDVGAVCLAHALADAGEARILAIVHNAGLPEGIGAVSVINHYYGRDDIDLGAFKGAFQREMEGPFVPNMMANFPSPIRNYSQVDDAVEVYRRTLAAQPDRSVVIASIGFMTNLAALLQSGADGHSPLTGPALLTQKVARIEWMGGMYPDSFHATEGRAEYNFHGGLRDGADWQVGAAATHVALDLMPAAVPLRWSGFEVGVEVGTGGRLTDCAPASNPCRQAFIDMQGPGNNRPSWDPITVLVATRGPAAASCGETGHGGVNRLTSANGSNAWAPGPSSNQLYLTLLDADAVGDTMDELLCRPPAHGSHRPHPHPHPRPRPHHHSYGWPRWGYTAAATIGAPSPRPSS